MRAYGSNRKGIIWHNTKIKFRSVKDAFQKKLKEDIPNIKQPPNVFIFSDKSSNIYEMPEQQHKKLVDDNVTKTYKKSTTPNWKHQ